MISSRNHPISCGLATSSFSRIFEKRSISNRKFDIVVSPINRVISQSTQSQISLDKNGSTAGSLLKTFLRSTNATYATDYIVSAKIRSDGYFQPIAIESLSPSILAHPSDNGISTFQSVGKCVLCATSLDGETSCISVNTASIGGQNIDTFLSWVTGSLARHCTDQINTLTSNKTQLDVFSTMLSSNFIRNNLCWANGVDLSCASPWNSEAGFLYAGTLVSPRHVMFCQHSSFYPSNNQTIKFVSQNNEIVTKTITNSMSVPNIDIRIAILDSDVSENIKFAKVLPSNWESFMPKIDWECTVPVMCLNQSERASISAISGLGNIFLNSYPNNYSTYYRDIIKFDSGNPVFLIINGEPILVGVFSGGGAGNGSFVSSNITSINSVMSQLGGGYQLNTINLSEFLTY